MLKSFPYLYKTKQDINAACCNPLHINASHSAHQCFVKLLVSDPLHINVFQTIKPSMLIVLTVVESPLVLHLQWKVGGCGGGCDKQEGKTQISLVEEEGHH